MLEFHFETSCHLLLYVHNWPFVRVKFCCVHIKRSPHETLGHSFRPTFSKSRVVAGRSETDFDGIPLLRDLRHQIGYLVGRDVVLSLDESHDARGAQLAISAEVPRRGEDGVSAQGVAAAAEDRPI